MILQAFAPMADSSWLQTLPGWFHDPKGLLLAMGLWVLQGTPGTVLIESGVLFPVLPGDSLLFTTGLLRDRFGLYPSTLTALTFIAAFVGAQIDYWIGARFGRRLFSLDARFLKTEYLDKAEHYSADYGDHALVISRLVLFVRTFTLLATEIARYSYSRFLVFNSLGVLLWGPGITHLGSVLGGAAFVHDHLSLIILTAAEASLLPMIIEFIVYRSSKDSKAQDSGAKGLDAQDLNPEDEIAREDDSGAARVGEAASCSGAPPQATPFNADAADAASEEAGTTSENLSEQLVLGQWWTPMPTIIEMLIVAVLPAVFWMYAEAHSPLISFVVAPATTFFLIIVLSILFDRIGISWQREYVLPALGILTLVDALVPVFTGARELTGGRVTRGTIFHALGERRLGGTEPGGAETSGFEKARAARGRVEPNRVKVIGAETSGLEKGQMSQGRVARVGGEGGCLRQGRVEPEPVDGPIWAMVAAGSLLAALPMLLHTNPGLPTQQWDSTFHLNGVWSVLQFGSTSPFEGLSDLHGGRSVFYLTTQHAFTIFFSTSSTVIRMANASSTALMIMWALGASILTSVITRRRDTTLAVPILSGLLLDIPADSLTMYNQWPSAMDLAAVPGIVVLAVTLSRRIAGAFRGGIRPLLHEFYLSISLPLDVAGASVAHPSSAFVLAVLLIPAFLTGSVTVLRRAVAPGSWPRVIPVTLIVVFTTFILSLTSTTSRIRAVGEYPRPGFTWSYILLHMFTPTPPPTGTTSMSMMILPQVGLVLPGIAYLSGLMTPKLQKTGRGAPSFSSITRGPGRKHEKPSNSKLPLNGGQWDDSEPGSHDDLWDDKITPLIRGHPGEWLRARDWLRAEEPLWPIASYLVFCALTLLAYALLGEVRTSPLAPWCLDARCAMGAHGLIMVPLMALSFDLLASVVHKILLKVTGSVQSFSLPQLVPWRVKVALGLVLLALSDSGALDSRLTAADYVYDSEKLGKPGIADTVEPAVICRMRLRTPDDSLVLGDPIVDATYTEVLGQYGTVFPRLNMTNGGERQQQAPAYRFKDIHTDPEVYEVVRELGITHFYEDKDGWYYNFKRSMRSPDLYGVGTSMDFKLVDRGEA